MNKFLIPGLAGVFVIGVILFIFFSRNQEPVNNEIAGIQEIENPQGSTSPIATQGNSEYKGKVLAGVNSKYLEFNSGDYEKAKKDGKVIFLDFYANWCPICRAESPLILSGFNELSSDQVVGFRVNFNDSETDEAEKALALEFDIPYQHTKVILVGGDVVLKDGDAWDKETFLTEIGKAIN